MWFYCWLGGGAFAAEVEVHVGASVVLMHVDGTLSGFDESLHTMIAKKLPAGSHTVQIRSLLGKVLAETTVEIGATDVARFHYRDGALVLGGLVPASAQASQIQVLAGESLVWLDGVPLSVDETDGLRKRTSLRPGTHILSATDLLGSGAELSLELEAGQIARYRLQDGNFALIGAAAVGTPYEELPGADLVLASKAASDRTKNTLEAVASAGSAAQRMDPDAFEKLLGRINAASGAPAKLEKIGAAASRNTLTCRQVGRLMDSVAAPQRREVVELTRAAIANPAECEPLLEKLPTPEDKRAARGMLGLAH